MPNPKDYDSQDKWMSACVKKLKKEGKDKPRSQCFAMWKSKTNSDDKES